MLSFDNEKQDLQISSVNIPEVGDTRLARDSEIILTGIIPAAATKLMWQWPETYGNHVIRISSPEQEEVYTAIFKQEKAVNRGINKPGDTEQLGCFQRIRGDWL